MDVIPTVRPLGGPLGAEVDDFNWRSTANNAQMRVLRDAWARHLVLLFRGQPTEDDTLISFSRQFGELDPCPPNDLGRTHIPSHPEIVVISNVVRKGIKIGSLGSSESTWHTDMSYTKVPPRASLLHALEIPSIGGDTQFCNMYMVLEQMPDDLRARIQGAHLVHDESNDSVGNLRKGWQVVTDPSKAPGARHPMVRMHPVTGRAALFLGRRRNAHVVGYPVAESEALLDKLWSHATRPEYAWTHRWQVGDLLLWDNRCTMHRRDEFDSRSTRIMHRTQVSGEPVVAPKGWSASVAAL